MNTLTTVAGIATIIIFLLVVGEWVSGYGGLKNRVENVAERQADMREEMRQGFRDMRDEIRISKADVISAIGDHTHDQDTGHVVFKTPVQ